MQMDRTEMERQLENIELTFFQFFYMILYMVRASH